MQSVSAIPWARMCLSSRSPTPAERSKQRPDPIRAQCCDDGRKLHATHATTYCPQISIDDGGDKHKLEVTWTNVKHKATLKADVEDMSFDIIATQADESDTELHTYRYACILSHAQACLSMAVTAQKHLQGCRIECTGYFDTCPS